MLLPRRGLTHFFLALSSELPTAEVSLYFNRHTDGDGNRRNNGRRPRRTLVTPPGNVLACEVEVPETPGTLRR